MIAAPDDFFGEGLRDGPRINVTRSVEIPMTKLSFLPVLATAVFMLAGAAQAHTKVVTSMPAANTAVAPTNMINVTFNEAAVPTFSGADVVMTTMPHMVMKNPMKMTGLKPTWSADGKTITLSAGRPFPKGTYQVTWHAVGADTHRTQGSYSFSVK